VCTTPLAPAPQDPASTILEPYRLWSFVLNKANDSWIWMALCRQTRQVVGYAVGDRSKRTCQQVWEARPEGDRLGHCFTDFWAASAAVIPEEQHTAVGPRGALEHHLAPTLGPFCAYDVLLFQISDHA
jgi:IS1 family transposase